MTRLGLLKELGSWLAGNLGKEGSTDPRDPAIVGQLSTIMVGAQVLTIYHTLNLPGTDAS